MANYYQNTHVLSIDGYEIYFTRFADSIINDHFLEAKDNLTRILTEFRIQEQQIISGGGGLSKITQQLGSLLSEQGWTKKIIESQHHVGGKVLTSESHEVDHYKSFDQGNIGLEIEWNNKDPFYDRDLENFRKLHQIGDLSMGIIITRGASLQSELLRVITRFVESLDPFTIENLMSKMDLSDKAKAKLKEFFKLGREEAVKKISGLIYASKYGAATTHMDKLLLRLDRGVGNPCPFILIGIGKEKLVNEETVHQG